MANSPTPSEDPKNREEAGNKLDASKQKALEDPAKQEQYRQEYLRQFRLLSCPGCGETDLF